MIKKIKIFIFTKIVDMFYKASEIDEEKFRKLYIKLLNIKNSDVLVSDIKVLEMNISLNNKNQKIFLWNAFKLCRQGNNIFRSIDKYSDACLETLMLIEKYDKTSIMPVIKDKRYFNDVMIQSGDRKEFPLVKFSLNRYFDVFFVEDSEFNMKYIDEKSLGKFKIANKEDLLKCAIDNLKLKFPVPEIQGDDGLFMVVTDGNYESSEILNGDLIIKLSKLVDGKLMVMIPARDMLLAVGSNDVKGILKIEEYSRKIINESPYSLVEKWMEWDGENLQIVDKPEIQQSSNESLHWTAKE